MAAGLVFGHCLPLVMRRRAPALCLLLVSCAFAAYQALGYRPTFAMIALYSAGVHQVRRRQATEAAWIAGYAALSVCLVALGSPSPAIEHIQFLALPAGC